MTAVPKTARAPGQLRVLLVVAPGEHTMYTRMNLPPFGPAIVAAGLRAAGLETRLCDLNSALWRMWQRAEFTKDDLAGFYEAKRVISFVCGGRDEALDEFAGQLLTGEDLTAYDVVGVSAGGDFSWLEMHSAAVIAAHVQRHYGKPVVIGGNNLDYLMQFEDAFHSLWVACLERFDAMVTGPGETVFLDLAATLAGGSRLPDALPGVARLRHGQVVRSPDAVHQILPPDFTDLYLEDYGNFVQRETGTSIEQQRAESWNRTQLYRFPAYLSWAANEMNSVAPDSGVCQKLIIPYVFNYNCPYSCAFCTESLERIRLVHANVDQVITHMTGLAEKYQTSYLYLFNNYFNLRNGFIEDFASRAVLYGLDFNWSDCARFNSLTYERLALLADSGCRKLTFGLETASGTMLDIIDKRVKLGEAERVLRWCKEVGIWADLEIITGLPHEDDRAFAETVRFLENNAEYINYFNVNRYFIAPKSLMGASPEAYGMRVRKHPNAYQLLLDSNYEWLCSGKGLAYKPQNFRVYEFDEIGGRTAEQLAADTGAKIARLNAIQSSDFHEAWHVLNLLHLRRMTARRAAGAAEAPSLAMTGGTA